MDGPITSHRHRHHQPSFSPLPSLPPYIIIITTTTITTITAIAIIITITTTITVTITTVTTNITVTTTLSVGHSSGRSIGSRAGDLSRSSRPPREDPTAGASLVVLWPTHALVTMTVFMLSRMQIPTTSNHGDDDLQTRIFYT